MTVQSIHKCTKRFQYANSLLGNVTYIFNLDDIFYSPTQYYCSWAKIFWSLSISVITGRFDRFSRSTFLHLVCCVVAKWPLYMSLTSKQSKYDAWGTRVRLGAGTFHFRISRGAILNWMKLLIILRVITLLPEHTLKRKILSFWWNFHHCLHCKLSLWQLPVQSV